MYGQQKKQIHIEDHEEQNLITFMKQLKDEEISIYFTHAFLAKTAKWNDEQYYDVIDLSR